jgi:hypothetical protein
MRKNRTQSEKLFSNEELAKVIKKMDSLELMEKIDNTYGLSKIFNNTNYNKVKTLFKKVSKL